METAIYEIVDGEAVKHDFTQLRQDPVSGDMVRLPRNIATRWSDAELAAWGLYRPVDERAEPDPEDFDVMDQEVAVDAGKVVLRYILKPVVRTNRDVDYERERRIALGLAVDITGLGTINVQTRKGDQDNIRGLVQLASLMLASALPRANITFRDADNKNQSLTAEQIIQMGANVFAHVDALWKASWALKDRKKLPKNYRNDKHWP